MSWSYSGDPANSTSDTVRFFIGDTNEDDQLLSDEEITFLLSRFGDDPDTAAAFGASILAARFSRLAIEATVDDVRVKFADRASYFSSLAVTLVPSADSANPLPYVGGISQDAKTARYEDEDLNQPTFYSGMLNPDSNSGYWSWGSFGVPGRK